MLELGSLWKVTAEGFTARTLAGRVWKDAPIPVNSVLAVIQPEGLPTHSPEVPRVKFSLDSGGLVAHFWAFETNFRKYTTPIPSSGATQEADKQKLGDQGQSGS